MRNFKTYIFVITIIAFISCEDNEVIGTSDNGVDISLVKSSISRLDENVDMELSIKAQGSLTVKSLKATDAKDTIKATTSQDLTIADNKATFNSSIFGSLTTKKDDIVTIDATLSNGELYKKEYTVSFENPISITSSLSNIKYKSSLKDSLKFKTSTHSAKIESLVLQWKKGKKGTYQDDANFSSLNIEKDTIYFQNFDNTTNGYGLGIKDTLYYRLIAKSGELADSLEISIPIITQPYSTSGEGEIGTATKINKFNLNTGSSLPDFSTVAEIKMDDKGAVTKDEYSVTTVSGGITTKEEVTDISFVEIADISSSSLSYVYTTKEKLLEANDALVSKELFEANTSKASITLVSVGQLFGYKVTRKKTVTEDKKEDKVTTTIKYGLILVTSVDVETNSAGSTTLFGFSYGEGEVK